MADKFLDETDFMDRLIFNEKRRSEVFQRIIEKVSPMLLKIADILSRLGVGDIMPNVNTEYL